MIDPYKLAFPISYPDAMVTVIKHLSWKEAGNSVPIKAFPAAGRSGVSIQKDDKIFLKIIDRGKAV